MLLFFYLYATEPRKYDEENLNFSDSIAGCRAHDICAATLFFYPLFY